jgi:hypothetical protein
MSRDLSAARSRRRIALNLAAIAASVGCFTPRGWGQTQNSTYTGATGNWNNAANWTPNGIPNNGTNGFTDYIATVAANTSVDATLNSPVTIDTLTVKATDTLTLASGITMTLEGPTLMNNGTIVIDTQDSNATLDFAADTNITGNGTIMLNDFVPNARIAANAGVTVTLASGTIDGVGEIDAPLISSGTIDANYGNQYIYINSPTLTNTGTIEATASGILEFEDSTSVTNTGGLIAATAGNVILTGTASITGGTLSSTGSHLFSVAGTASLSNVTITPGTQVTIQTNELLNYGGPNLVNNGTITIDTLHGDADLNFTSNTNISGTGTMTLNDWSPNAKITASPSFTVTQSATSTINGVGEIDAPLVNNGLINANYPNQALDIYSPTLTNSLTMEATGGGTLWFDHSTAVTNTGALISANGGNVVLTGSASISGGTLTSASSNSFSVTGTASLGNVTLSSGSTIVIQPNQHLNYTGPAFVNNGNIQIDTDLGDADLNFTSNTTLSGTGTIALDDYNPNARITGNTGVTLVQNPGSTINGVGEIDLPVTNNGLIDASASGHYININAPLSGTGTLEVSAGAQVVFGSGVGASTLGSLSIASTGQLDIANNHLFIDYGSGSDPISAILADLKSGYNNGAWSGNGIISSSARTQTNGLTYSVGWADGNDGTGNVAGLSSGQIELKYTLLGDANLDGNVNGSDFSILAANFGLGVTNWDQGNFLYGSSVNGSDFSALATNFGQGDSNASVTPADIAALDAFAAANGLPTPTIAAVPEPATLGILALGTAATLLRRKRSPR